MVLTFPFNQSGNIMGILVGEFSNYTAPQKGGPFRDR